MIEGIRKWARNSFLQDEEEMYHMCGPPLEQLSLQYSFAEVVAATDGFRREQLLGSGNFGKVYRGILRDGTEVAVKVLSNKGDMGFEEEVRVLSRFRHPNLVTLLGFSRDPEGERRCLLYEYLAGGDVQQRLERCSRDSQRFPFPADLRLSVALDAATGLAHLHRASPKV